MLRLYFHYKRKITGAEVWYRPLAEGFLVGLLLSLSIGYYMTIQMAHGYDLFGEPWSIMSWIEYLSMFIPFHGTAGAVVGLFVAAVLGCVLIINLLLFKLIANIQLHPIQFSRYRA